MPFPGHGGHPDFFLHSESGLNQRDEAKSAFSFMEPSTNARTQTSTGGVTETSVGPSMETRRHSSHRKSFAGPSAVATCLGAHAVAVSQRSLSLEPRAALRDELTRVFAECLPPRARIRHRCAQCVFGGVAQISSASLIHRHDVEGKYLRPRALGGRLEGTAKSWRKPTAIELGMIQIARHANAHVKRRSSNGRSRARGLHFL